MRPEVQARLDRFVERAGSLPVDEAARRLWRAVGEGGASPPPLLCAAGPAWPARPGDPGLGQPKRGALIRAAGAEGPGGKWPLSATACNSRRAASSTGRLP